MRFRLKNKSYVLNTKIKLVGKNGANLSIITSDINNPTSNYNLTANTITFCLSPLPAVIGDPEVVVNQYTTAALDFENNLIDKIPTTVWTKEGTADITSVNKIFGENSFETKALGDSLYTNSNILTGGATPFTIEFYALIKKYLSVNNFFNGCAILAQNKGGGDSDQQILIQDNRAYMYRGSNGGANPFSLTRGSTNINFNDINKYTLTYDGVALRFFINDKLDITVGTLTGWDSSHQNPFKFFDNVVSGYTQYRVGTDGIIDNINIHDGIATKVRDPDPYEEFLVVDLAFDGENNSTKIVDNGTLNSNWTVSGNAKISIDQKFDGFSSLFYTGGRFFTTISKEYFTINQNEDVTLTLDYYCTDSSGSTKCLIQLFKSSSDRISFYLWNPNRLRIYFDGSVPFDITLPYDTANKWVRYRVIISNNTWYIYSDNILVGSFYNEKKWDGDFQIFLGESGSNSEFFSGYFKNFKIYKGAAIIPENPTGKIQLDFDNNVVDKYGNSTWTNNGVTFDQVNSIKGYSAYFDSITTDYLETSSELLNFNKGNFKIDFSFKNLNSFGELFSNNIPPNSVGSLWYPINNPNSSFGYLDFYGRPSNTTYNDRINIGNVWYDNSIVKKNNILIEYRNDVVAYIMNGVSDITFNFIGGGKCRIGKPTSTFGTYDGFGGYLDNFKSYKEDLVNLNTTIYHTGTNGGTVSFNTSGDVFNSVWASGTGTFPVRRYTYVFDDCPSITDYIIEAEVLLSSTDNKILRLSANTTSYTSAIEDNFAYSFYVYNNTIAFSKGGNGITTWTEIESETIPSEIRDNNFHIFKIVKNGNNFRLYLDNSLYIDANDSSYSNISSKIAFGGNNYTGSSLRTTTIKSIKVSNLNNNEIYYRDWKSKITDVIDKPAVHLPLETNAINTGFTPLTVNSVGEPTYTTIDGKKCIKFESGKYLTVNANNIFNLGTNSDFYVELDLYIPTIHSDGFGHAILNGNGSTNLNSLWLAVTPQIVTGNAITKSICLTIRNPTGENYNNFQTSNLIDLSSWNNLKFYRADNTITLELNGVKTEFTNFLYPIDLATVGTFIGSMHNNSSNANFDGYMTNFKMFIGTSEIPETYNDKKVLDLDFKPTRKSYLFKDNNNKCVIHPVNITQRDYQDSQYCCSFNGTNQYLQLGKNELLNFGNDDFIIYMKFKINVLNSSWSMLLCDAVSSTNWIDIAGDGALCVKVGGVRRDSTTQIIQPNVLYNMVLSASNSVMTLNLNGVIIPLSGSNTNIVSNVNFNLGNNTTIGRYEYSANEYFNGTIYSLKVFRNTNDLSLIT